MNSTEFPRLHGEETINALHNFMKNLDETENNTLTKRQITTLKKAAEGIITSIKTEESKDSQIKATELVSSLRTPIIGHCQNSGLVSKPRRLWRVTQ